MRASPLALGLVIALVWMINALNNRPQDFYAERRMANALLPFEPVVSEEMIDEEQVFNEVREPRNPYNLFCIAGIKLDLIKVPTPRLHAGLRLDDDLFGRIVRIPLVDLQHMASSMVNNQGAAGQYQRVHNKMIRTPAVKRVPTDAVKLQSVEQQGFTLKELEFHDEGSDLEDENVVRARDQSGLDNALTLLFHQFEQDVLIKAPNPRGSHQPSYCRMSEYERCSLHHQAMKEPNLARIWRRAGVRLCNRNEWTAVFNRCFPKATIDYSKTQNWKQVQWPTDWKNIKMGLAPEAVDSSLKSLRKAFDELAWAPAASSERVWSTKSNQYRYTLYSSDGDLTGPAPLIDVNPAFRRFFKWEDGPVLGRET
jgi:hypothetical protein